MAKFIDLSGKRFNRLIVLNRAENKIGKYTVYKCQCDCGNIKEIRAQYLIDGRSKSCGCLNREKASIQGKSKTLASGMAAAHALYHNYIVSAKRRNREFLLSFEQAMILFKSSCYYCNSEPFQIMKTANNSGIFIYNGIDRIDNTQGYFMDNCVPCCKYCNVAKNTFSVDQFEKWIDQVYNHIHKLDRG